MKDYYALLGVQKGATKDEIVKAYRRGAQQHHPDRNPGDAEAEARFKEIQEAYDVLSDPLKRSEYDSGGSTMRFSRRSPGDFNFDGMMNDLFQNASFRGRNIQIRLELDLEEAYKGGVKSVFYKTRNLCPACHGQGQNYCDVCTACGGQGFTKVNNAPFEFRTNCTNCAGVGKVNPKKCDDCDGSGALPGYKENKVDVNLPKGVAEGTQFRLVGLGESSIRPGGKAGDAIVFVLLKEHPLFTRDGIDLHLEIPVSYTQLVLGADLEVPTIGGEKILLKIPPGTQSHAKLKVKGMGMQTSGGAFAEGDLIVTVKVETPKEIGDDYKSAVEALAEFERTRAGPKRHLWQKKCGFAE